MNIWIYHSMRRTWVLQYLLSRCISKIWCKLELIQPSSPGKGGIFVRIWVNILLTICPELIWRWNCTSVIGWNWDSGQKLRYDSTAQIGVPFPEKGIILLWSKLRNVKNVLSSMAGVFRCIQLNELWTWTDQKHAPSAHFFFQKEWVGSAF